MAQEEAKIPALSPGFLQGFALFETMRSYNGTIVRLGRHLRRMADSAKLLGLEPRYPGSRLRAVIGQAVGLSGSSDARVRIILSKGALGTDTLIIAQKYDPPAALKYRNGFKVCISSLRQDESSFLSGLKTTSRVLYELSFNEARTKGLDEAVILNKSGYVAECSRSNIFFVQDKAIYTPSLVTGCLGGITRSIVFDLSRQHGLKIYEGKFIVQDVSGAQEAFLTNSLMGIMPLVSLEGRAVNGGAAGAITRSLMKDYRRLLIAHGK